MPVRAVVFDLWDTIVDYVPGESERLHQRIAERLGVPLARFQDVWLTEEAMRSRSIGRLAPCFASACAALGVEANADELVAWRREATQRALVSRDGLVPTLAELRRRGLRVGLISNCTEEVADVWPETEFARYFHAAVFSATAGLAKPDAEIYRRAAGELGVRPEDCLFVGDGANDELAGAERVGMTPVLIHRDGEDPYWEDLRDWDGLRITSVSQVLDLVE